MQRAMDAGDVDAVRFLGAKPGAGMSLLSLLCLPSGKAVTPLELAVSGGTAWTTAVSGLALAGALFEAPDSELALGLARLRRRVQAEAEKLPKLNRYWDPQNLSDGLDTLRSLVPRALHPTPEEQATLGDIPHDWITYYQIKIMRANAHSSQNASVRREMELLLSAQGFDSFARNYSLGAILLALILLLFSLLVYVSFRLRVFGWFEVPISMAENASRSLQSCATGRSRLRPVSSEEAAALSIHEGPADRPTDLGLGQFGQLLSSCFGGVCFLAPALCAHPAREGERFDMGESRQYTV